MEMSTLMNFDACKEVDFQNICGTLAVIALRSKGLNKDAREIFLESVRDLCNYSKITTNTNHSINFIPYVIDTLDNSTTENGIWYDVHDNLLDNDVFHLVDNYGNYPVTFSTENLIKMSYSDFKQSFEKQALEFFEYCLKDKKFRRAHPIIEEVVNKELEKTRSHEDGKQAEHNGMTFKTVSTFRYSNYSENKDCITYMEDDKKLVRIIEDYKDPALRVSPKRYSAVIINHSLVKDGKDGIGSADTIDEIMAMVQDVMPALNSANNRLDAIKEFDGFKGTSPNYNETFKRSYRDFYLIHKLDLNNDKAAEEAACSVIRAGASLAEASEIVDKFSPMAAYEQAGTYGAKIIKAVKEKHPELVEMVNKGQNKLK